MDVEIIPDEQSTKSSVSTEPSLGPVESEVLPRFDVDAKPHRTSQYFGWVRQNRLKATLLVVMLVAVLGFIGLQILPQEPPKQVIEVRTFEDCVKNNGVILEGTNPRECYLKQKKFVEEKAVQPQEPTSTESEKSAKDSKVTNQKYTNAVFPNFGLTYPSDWKKSEENTETGTTLLFQKEGLTLSYNIALVEIFGEAGGQCTDNTLLFVKLADSNWYRVRANNGDRYYVLDLVLKSQGMPDSEPVVVDNADKIKTEWVEVSPLPKGVYEACIPGSYNIAGLTDSSIPAQVGTNTGFKYGLVTVRISGINDKNQHLLQEADKIVISTTL